MPKRFMRLLALALLGPALFWMSCRRPAPDSRLIRISDEIGAKDFVSSPLFDLKAKLPRVRKTVAPEDLTLLAAATRSAPGVWACSLQPPALGVPGSGRPLEIRVRDDKKELAYSPTPGLGKKGWSYLPSRRRMAARRMLFLGERWTQNLVLPAGKTVITALVDNPQPKDYVPTLRFILNGRSLGETAAGDQSRLTVSSEVETGFYKLEVVYDSGTNLTGVDERGAFLRLVELVIECSSDVLLLTLPLRSSRPSVPRLEISYAADARDSGATGMNAILTSGAGDLYSFQNDESASVADVRADTEIPAFKGKLRWRGQVIDIILAPPHTEFVYSFIRSRPSYLEFGCGILHDAIRTGIRRVNFRVMAEVDGRRIQVFKKSLGPRAARKHGPMLRGRVDLDRFRGRNVRLSFITETALPPGTAGEERIARAFWVNPIIFSPASGPTERPNVILISIDTLRADHLGCYGYPRPTSPGLDGLAAEGILFENAFSPSSWTFPAHMSLLTGQTLLRHGGLHEFFRVDPKAVPLADRLRRHGYLTGAFTAGGYVSSRLGFSRGFDFYADEGMSVHNARAPEVLLRMTSDWIERNADKTFFLFLHTYQPHNPYSSPAPFGQMFLTAGDKWADINLQSYLGLKGYYRSLTDEVKANIISLYDGDIRYTDEAFVGPLLLKLKALGLFDRTMIIVTSDHGEEFFEHGGWFHGQSLYHELIRVPLIIKLPGSRQGGQRIRHNARLIDVVPTVLKGLKIPYDLRELDGRDLFPLIRGEERASREILAEIYGQIPIPSPLQPASPYLKKVAASEGNFKLVFSINHNRYNLFFSPPLAPREPVEIELFDLDQDPLEKTNIASRRPDLVRSLMGRIRAYYARGRKEGSDQNAAVDEAALEQLRALGYIH